MRGTPQSDKMLRIRDWLNYVLHVSIANTSIMCLQRPKTGQAELCPPATLLFPFHIYRTHQFYSDISNPELPGFHPTLKTLTALNGCENNNNNEFKVHFGVERRHRGPLSPWNQQ